MLRSASVAVGLTLALGVGSGGLPGRILTADSIAGVSFGTRFAVVQRNIAALAGSSAPLHASGAEDCGVDVAQWPGLTLDFRGGRLDGYTLFASRNAALSSLHTARGLRLGDSTAVAARLYGSAMTTSWAQGGSFALRTAGGEIVGYLADARSAKPAPGAPGGRVLSLGAGDEGCPAMTP